MKVALSLSEGLKRYFGYDGFRPLQREIMEASLAGRDTVVILPTGAGKSLCFQLPALLRDGPTLVVSPLIALMKDQVDALTAAGVAATFLNSSLDGAETRRRREGLAKGTYRLLYAAPERVMAEGFAEDLVRWGVAAVAVDEAHCISQWGHDFRPEYRQLSALRERLRGVPFMALTATATERVRADIAAQLHLASPQVFQASFNRPNLSYHVRPKKKPARQVFEIARAFAGESGIVYAGSRRMAETLAATLAVEGIRALPYHAGLTAELRTAHQEAFLRDEVQVICATVAFGMGINKPDVRYIVHADLPKNIEGYYQETGRAGRDGLPSECVLLYSPGDLVKNLRFFADAEDPEVARVAERQMRQMADFAEADVCRRAALLNHFGEAWTEDNCGGCDVCLQPRERWEATVEAQKLMSCLVRIQRHSGFATGIQHVIEVLAGANTERIRRWGHDQLSTYGIGKDLDRAQWSHLARQLQVRGLIATSEDGRGTVSVTAEGLRALKQRNPIVVTRLSVPPEAQQGSGGSARPRRAGEIPCDEGLFEQLRLLRKSLADTRSVPPYVIFGDITLRHIARTYPADDAALLTLPGVGRKKLEDHGADFLRVVAEWRQTHPAMEFEPLDEPAPPKMVSDQGPRPTALATLEAYRTHGSLAAAAQARAIALSTATQHLVDCIRHGRADDLDPAAFYSEEQAKRMADAAGIHGWERLAPIHEALGGNVPYETLHLCRAFALRTKA
ncbi:MAG: DNA helicase RecQ [Opitutales bacterium]|nr:DNA helicase RecQ [Opitutales bacterium]